VALVIEHADGTSTPLIDASVHIFFPSNKALRNTLREPATRRSSHIFVTRAGTGARPYKFHAIP